MPTPPLAIPLFRRNITWHGVSPGCCCGTLKSLNVLFVFGYIISIFLLKVFSRVSIDTFVQFIALVSHVQVSSMLILIREMNC